MANQKITELDEITELQDDDLLVVVADVATTPVDKKITWANLNTQISGSSVFTSGGFETYRFIAVQSRPNNNAIDTIGHPTATPYADASANADDADGPFRRYDTSSTINNTAGINFNNGGLIRPEWRPQIFTKLKTGSNITSYRVWAGGGFSVAPPSVDDPTTHTFGFRFSTNASDTNWQAYSNDGSGGGTITDTGIAVTADTVYILASVIESTSSFKYYISTDNGITFSSPVTHTTNLPTNSMDYMFDVRNLTGAVRSLKHSFTHIRMR